MLLWLLFAFLLFQLDDQYLICGAGKSKQRQYADSRAIIGMVWDDLLRAKKVRPSVLAASN